MGTIVSVVLPEAERGEVRRVKQLFASWEETFSRFQPASELAAVNRTAGWEVEVSPLFFEVGRLPLEAARATGGLFDPTLADQMVALGYDRTFASLPQDQPARVPSRPGGAWRQVRLDPSRPSVRLPPGSGFDFGGLVKGMAVEAALDLLTARGVDVAAVDAGGDMAVRGLRTGEDAWPVAIELPEGDRLVSLFHGALATTSRLRRRWQQDGIERHHLLDPRTGEPASCGLCSVTVAARRCERAEVAAKAAFVLGPEAGAEFVASHGLAALFVLDSHECRFAGAWGQAA